MSRLISSTLRTGMASYHELDTVLSIEDCFDIVEISIIDAHNARVIREASTNSNR